MRPNNRILRASFKTNTTANRLRLSLLIRDAARRYSKRHTTFKRRLAGERLYQRMVHRWLNRHGGMCRPWVGNVVSAVIRHEEKHNVPYQDSQRRMAERERLNRLVEMYQITDNRRNREWAPELIGKLFPADGPWPTAPNGEELYLKIVKVLASDLVAS